MKRLFAVILLICLLLATTGCDKVSEVLTAEGRDYGQSYVTTQENSLKSSFFKFGVISAELKSNIDGYTPQDETQSFLVVNVVIEDIFDGTDTIPMSCYDFDLKWGEGKDKMTVPEDEFTEGQLPEEWKMKKGDKTEGTLIYIVPANMTKFSLVYLEIWDDDFEGNTYTINFTTKPMEEVKA